MKFKIILIFLLLTTIVSAIDVDLVDTLRGSSITFQNLRYTPYPVSPGDYFEIWFTVFNDGSSDVTDISFELLEEFPFTIYPGEEKIHSYSSIKKGGEVIFKYKVKVDDKALEGSQKLKVKYYSQVHEFDIQVQSRATTLSVESITTEPETIKQGQLSKLLITLSNDAQTSVRDISAKLDVSGTIFSTINSVTEKNVKILSPGEKTILEYDILADPDADSGPYNIPFKLNYYDSLDNLMTKNETIGIIVASPPQLEIIVEETEIYNKGDYGELTLSISNVGPTNLKFLTINLEDSKSYKIVSSPKVYIGDLDPDDFQTATFKIDALSNNIDLNIRLDYKDALNGEYSKNYEIPLNMLSYSQATKYGFKQNSSGVFSLIFYILIIMFIYYSYKEYRLHKNIEKSLKIALKRTIRSVIKFIKMFKPSNLKTIPKRFKKWLRDDN